MPCPYRTDSPRSLTRVFPWNFTVLNFDSNQQSISKALPRCLYKDFQWVTFVEVRFNLNLIAALWWHRNFHLHQGRHNILERATVPQSHTAFWCFCPPRGPLKSCAPPFFFVCLVLLFHGDFSLSLSWVWALHFVKMPKFAFDSVPSLALSMLFNLDWGQCTVSAYLRWPCIFNSMHQISKKPQEEIMKCWALSVARCLPPSLHQKYPSRRVPAVLHGWF